MTIETDSLEAAGAAMIARTPQAAAIGMRLVSVDGGVGLIRVPYRQDLVGDPRTGVVAGGVVTTLLDQACGLAIKLAARDFGGTATLDLRIDYMRPAQPRRDIFGRAHCYKLTRSIGFVRALAYDTDAGDPIATAQAAFVLTGIPAQPS